MNPSDVNFLYFVLFVAFVVGMGLIVLGAFALAERFRHNMRRRPRSAREKRRVHAHREARRRREMQVQEESSGEVSI